MVEERDNFSRFDLDINTHLKLRRSDDDDKVKSIPVSLLVFSLKIFSSFFCNCSLSVLYVICKQANKAN